MRIMKRYVSSSSPTSIVALLSLLAMLLTAQVSAKTITQVSFSDLMNDDEHDLITRHIGDTFVMKQVGKFDEIESLLGFGSDSSNESSQTDDIARNEPMLRQSNNKLMNAFFNEMTMRDSLSGGTDLNTETKMNDSDSPLDGSKSGGFLNEIIDQSDELLSKIEDTKSENLPPDTSNSQEPMDTQTNNQVLGNEQVNAPAPEPLPQPEPEPKVEENTGCDGTTAEDGIMNCEFGKNNIRMGNGKALDGLLGRWEFYEIAFFYGIVLSILIIIVLLISKFRESAGKYLAKHYVKSLRVIIVDVIALMTLNAIVQILYYNRVLDVIQLEYFNIYGFTITFSFFSMAWILMAVGYAFILQSFEDGYARYEANWPNRQNFLTIDNEEEETEQQYEERVRNIQYFLIKEDFVMPISHIVYSEPMVLREDFRFCEYLGCVQAKSHLHLFNISLTTLLILMVFFMFVCLIDQVGNWLIECVILLALPLISFGVAWAENRQQFNIISKLVNLIVHSYEIETQRFLNLDLKKPVQFRNKLKYPTYLNQLHQYEKEGQGRQESLFPFGAVQFPLKLVHFTLVLQIVWVMIFLFNYSMYLTSSWECQAIFAFGLFLIMFQLFFVIPFFLKKYAITANIQQLKDAKVVHKVIANQKERVTLAFAKFYRLLKHIRRVNSLRRKTQLKLRPEIIDQLKEIDESNVCTIEELAQKIGLRNLSNDEMYYLDKAFYEVSSSKPGSVIGAASGSAHGDDHMRSSQDEEQKKLQLDDSQRSSPMQHSSQAISHSPQNRHATKKASGFNTESMQLERSNNAGRLDTEHSKSGEQNKLLDIMPPVLANRPSKAEINVQDHSVKGQQRSQNQLSRSQISSSSLTSSSKAQDVFILANLSKVCSVLTEEVTLDPYRTSYDALLDIFDEKQQITHGEFSRMLIMMYKKIEQEQLNLIIHIDDIRLIENEVFYLEDKLNQISLQRIASLIRNSIEMLPR